MAKHPKNPPQPQKRVAIVGAGIGGSAVAFFLKQKGFIDITVFESRTKPELEELTKNGNGINLYFHCGRMLVNAGLPIEQYLSPNDIEFRHEDGKLLVDITRPAQLRLSKELKATKSSAYGILRQQLYAALFKEVNDKIVYQKKCVGASVNSSESQVNLEFADGSTSDAFDLVIGADGIHSKLADYILGKTRKLNRCNMTALQGLSTFNSWNPGKRQLIYINRDGSGGMGAMPCVLPTGEEGMFWWMTIGCDDLEQSTGKSTDDLTDREIYDDITKRYSDKQLVDCMAQTDFDSVQRWADLHDKDPLSPKYWKDKSGRIVLLGDACHANLPANGYGAGMALEDAFWLADALGTPQCLENPPGIELALQKYIRKRAKYTAGLAKESRLIMKLIHPPNRFLGALSNLGWKSGLPAVFLPRKYVSIFKTGLNETTWTEEEQEKGELLL